MKSKQEFLQFYDKLTQNDTELKEKIEKSPKTKTNKKWLYLFLALPVICIVFFIIAFTSQNLTFMILPSLITPMIFIFIFIAVICFLIPYFQKQRVLRFFDAKYKDQLIRFLLEDKVFLFERENCVKQTDFSQSKMFSYFNRYSGEDLVTIVTKISTGEAVIRFSDLLVQNVSKDSKGNSNTTTIFNGVFGYVQFPKQFEFQLGMNNGFWKYEKVSLESIDFNKSFKIYSSDQIMARLIFTPDRMQKLLNYKLSSRISLHLFNNRIYFAFHGQELFQSVLHSNQSQINVDDFYNDVCVINTLIEEMKKILNDIY